MPNFDSIISIAGILSGVVGITLWIKAATVGQSPVGKKILAYGVQFIALTIVLSSFGFYQRSGSFFVLFFCFLTAFIFLWVARWGLKIARNEALLG